MGDMDKEKSNSLELKNIFKDEEEIKEINFLPHQAPNPSYGPYGPPYQQPPPAQPYGSPYQQPPPGYYYNQSPYGTPYYAQRMDGQPVYYAGGPPPPPNVSRGGPPYQMNYPQQAEEDEYYRRQAMIFGDAFDSVKIRNRFVQRVYTILSFQLFFSFGIIFLAVYEPSVRLFFQTNMMVIMIVAMIIYIGTTIALFCVPSLRRSFPINFILLGILTIGLTLLLTIVSVSVPPNIVLYATGTTALVCFVVSIFACQTKWDVTGCGMCLCISIIVLSVFGLIMMILSLVGIYIKILHIVYSSIATILFSFWLMYDTQQIMGGRRYELSPEEYIYGAISLYIDIMYIFMHILTLFNLCSE